VNQVGEQVNEMMFVDENVDELVRQNTLTILKEKFDDPSKQAKERGNVLDENPDEKVVNQTTDYVPSTTSSKCLGPNQPILSEYPTKLLGSEPYPRRFNPQLYKKYPWITYEIENDQCVCFSCREFENDDSFVFYNWKKPDKLSKHGRSEKHITCMTKRALFIVNQKRDTSVLEQIHSAHKQQVISNRQNLQVILECLMFPAQKNIAMRGHVEDRKNIWEVSDINRGNFLE
jgi:hypothetical protein